MLTLILIVTLQNLTNLEIVFPITRWWECYFVMLSMKPRTSETSDKWGDTVHPACKTEWWGTDVVICLKRDANDLHMVQLMPLPLNISCFIKIQNGLIKGSREGSWAWMPSYRDTKQPYGWCRMAYLFFADVSFSALSWWLCVFCTCILIFFLCILGGEVLFHCYLCCMAFVVLQ